MITATVGTFLFVAVTVSSIVVARRRLRYEWWYAVHLTAYAAIALAWFHQIPTGNELVLDRVAADYWTSLYIATLAVLAVFRIGVPLVNALALPAARRRGRRGGTGRRVASDHRSQARAAQRATGPVLPVAVSRARLLVGLASVLSLRAERRHVAHHRQGARRFLRPDPPHAARHACARRRAVRLVHRARAPPREGRPDRRRHRHHADPRAARGDGGRRHRALSRHARRRHHLSRRARRALHANATSTSASSSAITRPTKVATFSPRRTFGCSCRTSPSARSTCAARPR